MQTTHLPQRPRNHRERTLGKIKAAADAGVLGLEPKLFEKAAAAEVLDRVKDLFAGNSGYAVAPMTGALGGFVASSMTPRRPGESDVAYKRRKTKNRIRAMLAGGGLGLGAKLLHAGVGDVSEGFTTSEPGAGRSVPARAAYGAGLGAAAASSAQINRLRKGQYAKTLLRGISTGADTDTFRDLAAKRDISVGSDHVDKTFGTIMRDLRHAASSKGKPANRAAFLNDVFDQARPGHPAGSVRDALDSLGPDERFRLAEEIAGRRTAKKFLEGTPGFRAYSLFGPHKIQGLKRGIGGGITGFFAPNLLDWAGGAGGRLGDKVVDAVDPRSEVHEAPGGIWRPVF